MPRLDVNDIQGNILRAYNMPVASYSFVRFYRRAGHGMSIAEATAPAREFVARVAEWVTTAEPWPDKPDGSGVQKPDWTFNIGFTCAGLEALGVPAASLATFPEAFREGMKRRAPMLGDVGPSAPEHWDAIWRDGGVHAWMSVNARSAETLREVTRRLHAEIAHGRFELDDGEEGATGAVQLLQASPDSPEQLAAALPSGREHFGYRDGYGDPWVAGAGGTRRTSTGKLKPDGKEWEPLATGEFVLGHANEGQEVHVAPMPHLLSRNGTFLVYRKLHQRVASFRRFLQEQGGRYGDVELFAAKLVGRWRDGFPLARYPDRASLETAERDARGFSLDDNLFTYGDDPDGARCPLGAHVRRANPRDSLGFDGKLANRRRIARRGLPYGDEIPIDEPGDDDGEHGVVFMVINADIETQFEAVLGQWINYGNEFGLGNDQDVLLGNHDDPADGSRDDGEPHKVVIPGDASTPGGRAPFICRGLPRFVDTRGGDYFFLPSVTGLELIAAGAVHCV